MKNMEEDKRKPQFWMYTKQQMKEAPEQLIKMCKQSDRIKEH